jgi:hypothetical protein
MFPRYWDLFWSDSSPDMLNILELSNELLSAFFSIWSSINPLFCKRTHDSSFFRSNSYQASHNLEISPHLKKFNQKKYFNFIIPIWKSDQMAQCLHDSARVKIIGLSEDLQNSHMCSGQHPLPLIVIRIPRNDFSECFNFFSLIKYNTTKTTCYNLFKDRSKRIGTWKRTRLKEKITKLQNFLKSLLILQHKPTYWIRLH